MEKKQQKQVRKCEYCGHYHYVGETIFYWADPYAYEMYGNTEKHWMCTSCHEEAKDEL